MTTPILVLPWLQLVVGQPQPDPDASSPTDPTVEQPAPVESEGDEPDSDEQRPDAPSPNAEDALSDPEVTPAAEVTPAEPRYDAMEHLARAQQLKVAGELAAAEAEVSVAISMDPDDPAAYLERAQIRMALAEKSDGETEGARRTRAALLRDAADDVEGYLGRADLEAEAATWFRAREEALRREADALDPPAPKVELAPVEPARPAPQIPPPPSRVTPADRSSSDVDHRKRSASLWGSGAAMSAGAVGLAAASLRIHRSCDDDDLCRVDWQTKPALLAPAAVLTALGTTSIVLGILDSPGMDRPRVRRATTATTLALGGTATALGTITAALAGAQWFRPVSPSDDSSLSTVMTLGNVSLSSFTAALPLLSAGITAAIRARRAKNDRNLARR